MIYYKIVCFDKNIMFFYKQCKINFSHQNVLLAEIARFDVLHKFAIRFIVLINNKMILFIIITYNMHHTLCRSLVFKTVD